MLRHQSLPLHFQVLISGDWRCLHEEEAGRTELLVGLGVCRGGREPSGHAADSSGVLTVLLAGLKGF